MLGGADNTNGELPSYITGANTGCEGNNFPYHSLYNFLCIKRHLHEGKHHASG